MFGGCPSVRVCVRMPVSAASEAFFDRLDASLTFKRRLENIFLSTLLHRVYRINDYIDQSMCLSHEQQSI